MEEENKRSKWLAFILIMMLIVSLGMFLWNFIDRGTITFTGDTPFLIEDEDRLIYQCDQSPCEIKMRSGYKYFTFYKDGFDSFNETIKLDIFKKINFNVDFAILAKVSNAEDFPFIEEKSYNLVLDQKNNNQKLVDANDKRERAIIYFKKIIEDPFLINSEDYVYIVNNSKPYEFYKVDIKAKTRQNIQGDDLMTIIDGKISLDGKYLVYKKENSEYLWVYDSENNIAKEMSIDTKLDNLSWDYLNRLFFVTKQSSSFNTSKEFEGDILISSENTENEYLFGYFLPDTDAYFNVLSHQLKGSDIEKFTITKNGKIIYFSTDKGDFKIILDKV